MGEPMNTTDQRVEMALAFSALETRILKLLDERDALRAALLAIRDHITPATAYPETVAWLRATVDGVVRR